MTVHLFLICLILEKSIFEVVMNYESDGDGGQVSLQRILNGRCSVRSLSRLEKSWIPPRRRSYSSGCNCAEREKIEVLILNFLYEFCMFVSFCHYVGVWLPVYAWVGDHQAKTISLGREKRIQSHGWERKSRWCDLPHTHWLQIFHQWRLYSFHFISWGRKFLWKHIGLKDWTFVA